jgi:hypothetical protein
MEELIRFEIIDFLLFGKMKKFTRQNYPRAWLEPSSRIDQVFAEMAHLNA